METIEYKNAGKVFRIRAHATRGDKYRMNAAMTDYADIKDGKVIRPRIGELYPWLIEHFVVSYNACTGTDGKEILKHLMDEPADGSEDIIMVLGAFILNHVKGLVPDKEDETRKNA